ncbi:ATP synthase F1 subunit epsilon [Clostridium paraputrificum]|uniref:ATP synthase F1 subunit epsilon n=1 Tax=Clostridium TaxID=1485 RepID=UPI003D32C11B
MAKTFKVKILTPSRVVIEEEAEKVFTSTINGNVEFLAGHAPIILSTIPCITIIEGSNGEKKEIFTSKGVINVKNNELTFCSDAAELPEEIDLARAESAKERAEKRIKESSKFDVERARAALVRAMVRMDLKKHSL